jgi:hypothetical protein
MRSLQSGEKFRRVRAFASLVCGEMRRNFLAAFLLFARFNSGERCISVQQR